MSLTKAELSEENINLKEQNEQLKTKVAELTEINERQEEKLGLLSDLKKSLEEINNSSKNELLQCKAKNRELEDKVESETKEIDTKTRELEDANIKNSKAFRRARGFVMLIPFILFAFVFCLFWAFVNQLSGQNWEITFLAIGGSVVFVFAIYCSVQVIQLFKTN